MATSNQHSTASPVQAAASRRYLSRKKRFVFIFGAGLIAAMFVALVEGALRLCGFGGHSGILRTVGDPNRSAVVFTDSLGSASYFYANRSKPGSIFETTFHDPKPAGTVRVMLLGESAAKGFPQPYGLASSAFLEAMLSDLWPERKVEVLNFGTTAVASFPIRCMLDEVIEHQPDLVIVYCGNNEFFGAYGVASLHSAGNTVGAMRFQRWVRSLGITQVVEKLTARQPSGPDVTLMERMMGQSYIGPADAQRDAAARNIHDNLTAMIDLCKARGVPILVCDSPVNEHDLAPLGCDNPATAPPDRLSDVRTMLEAARGMISADPDAALMMLKEPPVDSPDAATVIFLRGKALYAKGDFAAAGAAFQRAVELDPMPWRATKKTNDAIAAAAKDGGAIHCSLVDAFRRASPHGSIGWELMDDHVHPSLQGQDLVARSIARTLTSVDGPLHVDAARFAALPDWRTYAKRLGDTEYDHYAVAHTIRVLNNIPFFKETNPEALARYNKIVSDLEAGFPAEILETCRNWQKPETHIGGQRPITGMVGRVMIKHGRFAEAERLCAAAIRHVAPYTSWNLEFTYFNLVSRERVHGKLSETDRRIALDAIERGKFLLSHGTVTTGLTERFMGRLHQLRGEWAEAIPFLVHARQKLTGNDLVAADQALIESYVRTGDRASATRIIEQGEAQPQFAGQYRKMRQAFLKQ